eukprot:SM000003S11220  [mRNA]  locus=s3:1778363:1781484:+ [translate_table: standard]
MVKRLRQLYDQWDASPRALFVVLQVRAAPLVPPPGASPPSPRLTLEELRWLQGKGRAFCAGGDVRAIYDLGRAGGLPPPRPPRAACGQPVRIARTRDDDSACDAGDRRAAARAWLSRAAGVGGARKAGDKEACREFFREEYLTNHKLATLSKPHVAVLDGVVMGGGNGISMHGTFRVATDRTLFAMPETAIALHPDVGASYFLSRLPGSLGEYLGLTGARLNGAELVDIGLATHYVPSHRLKMLDERWGDMRVGRDEAVRFAIEEHAEIVELPHDSEERQKGGAEWCAEPLAALARVSPTSLKVTLRSIREGRRQDLKQCLEKEYRLTGVRAVLVEKDNQPQWSPKDLAGVSDEVVMTHFAPFENPDEELQLPPLQHRQHARLGLLLHHNAAMSS